MPPRQSAHGTIRAAQLWRTFAGIMWSLVLISTTVFVLCHSFCDPPAHVRYLRLSLVFSAPLLLRSTMMTGIVLWLICGGRGAHDVFHGG